MPLSLGLTLNSLLDKKAFKEIHFRNGIIGFPSLTIYHMYFLIKNTRASFYILRGANSELSFIIVNPLHLIKDYSLEISAKDFDLIELFTDIDKKNYLRYFVILTLHSDKLVTANCLAPIILNIKKDIACQVISLNSQFHTKHSIPIESLNF